MDKNSVELVIKAQNNVSDAINKINVDVSGLMTGFDALTKAAHAAAAALASVKAPAEIKETVHEVKVVTEQFVAQQAAVAGTQGQVGSLSMAFRSIAFAAVAASAAKVTKELAEAGMAAERLSNSMSASLGGMNQAKAAMSFLSDQSKALGTDLYASADAFQKLAASSRGTVLEGQKTRDIFTAISTASAALHLTSEQSSGALLAISQMMSKGNVQAEELRGQLGERLPGAFNIAARAMGVTTQELDKMLTQGQLVASDFLPKFARVLTDEYGGAATQAADSTSAAVNRMKNSWEMAKRDIGEILLPAIAKAAEKINALIESIAPKHLSDLEKSVQLQEKIANLKDRMTQPGMIWLLGDDLRKAESDLQKLQDSMSGINRAAGNWAVGMRNMHDAENAGFSKGDSWKTYFKEREAAYDRGAKAESAYYAGLDKLDEDSAKKAQTSADKALKEAERQTEAYRKSLDSVTNEYARLTLSAAEYEMLHIWQEWEKEAAKASDVALAVRDMKLAAVDAKAHLEQLRQDTLKNIAEKPENYANTDYFVGMKDAQKRAQDILDAGEKMNKALVDLSENAAKQVEKAWSTFFLDVITGKMNSLADFWENILNTMAKMTSDVLGQIMRQSIFGLGKGETETIASQLWGGISGLFTASAQGNVFAGPGIGAYENTIVTRPTLFPFATGVGLMGEAGAEAILPLTRTAGGDLGVKTTGAAAPNVRIEVNNTGTPQRYQQSDIHFDGKAWVIGIIAEDMQTDRYGLRTMLGGRR